MRVELLGYPRQLTFMLKPLESQRPEQVLPYMPQLDSLRALAALGVFIQHFLDSENLFLKMRLGDLGVRLFFVLSGFLITSLLFHARTVAQSRLVQSRTLLWHFYARRFLRLLPIYYIVLMLAMVSVAGSLEVVPWFLVYLQNVLFALRDEFALADHFWTLAVEEQFYLIWPLIILFSPNRLLLPIVIGTTLLGPVFRSVCVVQGYSHFQISMLTPAHFDTLGLGALLAILVIKAGDDRRLGQLTKASAIVGFLLLLSVLLTKILGGPEHVELLLGELGAGLLFVWVILQAQQGFSGLIGAILSSSILIYLGKISYGMYVYHWFMPGLLEHFGVAIPTNEWVRLFMLSIVSILVAMFSWHVIERPANGLKRHLSV